MATLLSKLAPLLTALVACGCGAAVEAGEVVVAGNRELRDRPESAPEASPQRPRVIVLAIDGVGRDLLYDMVSKGKLPEMSKLLYGRAGQFPHAHFDKSFLSTLPSSTMAAWVTLLTGVPPAEHGVVGNEFFIRSTRQFAAPIPVTFSDPETVFKCFTDGYGNALSLAPSLYERIRQRDRHAQIWVAMHHFHAGADRLLLTDRAIFAKAFQAFLEHGLKQLTGKKSRDVYATLDEQVIESVTDELEDDDEALPDVLTVYMSGTDQYAHVSHDGPDTARTDYLHEVLDPLVGELREVLEERRALDNTYVLVTSDHGHTEVVHDDEHALSMDGPGEPAELLRKLDLRVRPFREDVGKDADFQAVLAYQGAMAYVYLADRSTCEAPGKACAWEEPPRFKEDVLPVAEAFFRNNRDGSLVPALKGTLDLVLTRKPKPHAERDLPFEVYVGDGQLVPVEQYLAKHPRPTYVAFAERLRDLGEGRAGERAGDILLLANNGNRARPEQRYYFAGEYRSWHGSPSKQDSEVPLIVAHPRHSTQELAALTHQVLGDKPYHQRFTDLVLRLRYGAKRGR